MGHRVHPPFSESGLVHILVAEDDPGVARVVKEILEEEGYAVSSGRSVYQVRATVTSSKPDSILLNIDLEGLGDGLHLLAELASQGIQVIIFSAYDPLSARWPWHRGEIPFIKKPLFIDGFLEQIAALCPQDR